MPLAGLRLGISMLVLPLAAGCASDRDAIDRRLEGLSEDITRLQATNDRLMQRVDQLEVERAPRRDAKAPPAPQPEHAPLKVVKLEPESATALASPTAPVSPAELPDAPGDRPVIRLRGRSDGKLDSKSDDKAPAVSVRVVDEGASK